MRGRFLLGTYTAAVPGEEEYVRSRPPPSEESYHSSCHQKIQITALLLLAVGLVAVSFYQVNENDLNPGGM